MSELFTIGRLCFVLVRAVVFFPFMLLRWIFLALKIVPMAALAILVALSGFFFLRQRRPAASRVFPS